jgi:hypothetical protein
MVSCRIVLVGTTNVYMLAHQVLSPLLHANAGRRETGTLTLVRLPTAQGAEREKRVPSEILRSVRRRSVLRLMDTRYSWDTFIERCGAVVTEELLLTYPTSPVTGFLNTSPVRSGLQSPASHKTGTACCTRASSITQLRVCGDILLL